MASNYYGKTFPKGTQFTYGGVEYMILSAAKVNYSVVARDGRSGTFPMHGVTDANVLKVQDKAWADEALSQNALKEASAVVITGRGAGKFEGKTGYICKINGATYGVLIPNVGIVNAPKAVVKAAA